MTTQQAYQSIEREAIVPEFQELNLNIDVKTKSKSYHHFSPFFAQALRQTPELTNWSLELKVSIQEDEDLQAQLEGHAEAIAALEKDVNAFQQRATTAEQDNQSRYHLSILYTSMLIFAVFCSLKPLSGGHE